ncbi:MAG: hypothetical protein KatS3mg087_1112 [Patescibacteria group bacterium]|nr:MAG: hypothetical protein KatS3mg087_1112 [Patescibacteria group bacterium]
MPFTQIPIGLGVTGFAGSVEAARRRSRNEPEMTTPPLPPISLVPSVPPLPPRLPRPNVGPFLPNNVNASGPSNLAPPMPLPPPSTF